MPSTNYSNDILDIFARLSLHEFLIELSFAGAISQASLEDGERIMQELISRFELPPVVHGDFTPEREQIEAIIRDRSNEMARNFLNKIRHRAHELRQYKSPK
jgi:hypothetical protein